MKIAFVRGGAIRLFSILRAALGERRIFADDGETAGWTRASRQNRRERRQQAENDLLFQSYTSVNLTDTFWENVELVVMKLADRTDDKGIA